MEIWHKSFRDKLYRLALRLLNGSDEASDVAQEVWTRLWQRREEIPKMNNATSFAFTMTRNLCLDVLKSSRMKNERLDAIHENMLSDVKNTKHQDISLNTTINDALAPLEKMQYIKDANVRMCSKAADKDNISEFVMYVREGKELSLIAIVGKIDKSKIMELTKLSGLKGMENEIAH